MNLVASVPDLLLSFNKVNPLRKTNGSGGGGCIFAYACDKAESIAEALEKTGAKVYIVHIDDGVRKEN